MPQLLPTEAVEVITSPAIAAFRCSAVRNRANRMVLIPQSKAFGFVLCSSMPSLGDSQTSTAGRASLPTRFRCWGMPPPTTPYTSSDSDGFRGPIQRMTAEAKSGISISPFCSHLALLSHFLILKPKPSNSIQTGTAEKKQNSGNWGAGSGAMRRSASARALGFLPTSPPVHVHSPQFCGLSRIIALASPRHLTP